MVQTGDSLVNTVVLLEETASWYLVKGTYAAPTCTMNFITYRISTSGIDRENYKS